MRSSSSRSTCARARSAGPSAAALALATAQGGAGAAALFASARVLLPAELGPAWLAAQLPFPGVLGSIVLVAVRGAHAHRRTLVAMLALWSCTLVASVALLWTFAALASV